MAQNVEAKLKNFQDAKGALRGVFAAKTRWGEQSVQAACSPPAKASQFPGGDQSVPPISPLAPFSAFGGWG